MDKNGKTWFDLSVLVREGIKFVENESKRGKCKDELHGVAMTEFIALNPKC